MRGIFSFFKSAATLQEGEPQAICRVDGFELFLEKKQGGSERKPACEDSYYEVKIRPTGENPEYPAQAEASTYHYATGLAGFDHRLSENTGILPPGSRYTKFELVEGLNNASHARGRSFPVHHIVTLQAHFQDAQGESGSFGLGAWVRKSECDSTVWAIAARSPGFVPRV